jgi:hypothetical protein
VCLRDEHVLRLHMYSSGGTLMVSLESRDAGELKAITTAWLQSRGLAFDEWGAGCRHRLPQARARLPDSVLASGPGGLGLRARRG